MKGTGCRFFPDAFYTTTVISFLLWDAFPDPEEAAVTGVGLLAGLDSAAFAHAIPVVQSTGVFRRARHGLAPGWALGRDHRPFDSPCPQEAYSLFIYLTECDLRNNRFNICL